MLREQQEGRQVRGWCVSLPDSIRLLLKVPFHCSCCRSCGHLLIEAIK